MLRVLRSGHILEVITDSAALAMNNAAASSSDPAPYLKISLHYRSVLSLTPMAITTKRVIRETRAAGYTLAFTTNHGLAARKADPLAIPRVNIHENNAGSESRFMCACAGLF